MAQRLQQNYPMVPSGYNNGLVQQQQQGAPQQDGHSSQPGQGGQGQGPQQGGMNGLPLEQQQRLWMMQFGRQADGVAGMNLTPQMMELMKRRAAVQQQQVSQQAQHGQQQGGPQQGPSQQQQPFGGMGMSQQGFHDGAGGQHMPPGFPMGSNMGNMGGNMGMSGQMQNGGMNVGGVGGVNSAAAFAVNQLREQQNQHHHQQQQHHGQPHPSHPHQQHPNQPHPLGQPGRGGPGGPNGGMMNPDVTNADRQKQMELLFTAQQAGKFGNVGMGIGMQQGQGGSGPQQGQGPPQPGGIGGPGAGGPSSQQGQFGITQNPTGNQGPNQQDMFGSPSMSQETMRRPSPHPVMGHPLGGANIGGPNLGGAMPTGPSAPGPSMQANASLQATLRSLQTNSTQELTHKVNQLRMAIQALESSGGALQKQLENAKAMGASSDMLQAMMQKFREAQMDAARRREFLKAVILVLRQRPEAGMLNQNQNPPSDPGSSWAGPSNQGPGPSGQNFDPSNGQLSRPPTIGQPPNANSHMQTSPNLMSNQAPNMGIPPRTMGTPQQQVGPQLGNHGGLQGPFPGGMGMPSSPFKPGGSQMPGHGGPGSLGMPGGINGGNGVNGPSPAAMGSLGPTLFIDKSKFEQMFKGFCAKQRLKLDPRMLSIENRLVDLHALHVQVMQEGGFAKLENNDNLWCIIAGKLGFVQFPGTATEPARSGPGVGSQLHHIYKEAMLPFESWCQMAAQESRKNNLQLATQSLQAQLNAIRSPISMAQAPQLAVLSVQELQARGVDEKTIAFIDGNRTSLQRLWHEQKAFAAGVRGQGQPGGMGMNNGMGIPPEQAAVGAGIGGPRSGGMGGNINIPPFGGQTPMSNQLARQMMLQQQQQQNQQPGGPGPHMQGQLPGGMLGQRMPQQQQQQGPMPGGPNNSFYNTNSQTIGRAVNKIKELKMEFTRIDRSTRSVDVPVEQQMDYNQLLEQIHRQCAEVDSKLPMMAVFIKDDFEPFLRKMVDLIMTVNQQRSILSTASVPRYIISFDQLREMATELGRVTESFMANFRAQMGPMGKQLSQQSQQTLQVHQQQHPLTHPMMNNLAMSMMNKDMQPQPGRPVVPARPPSSVGGYSSGQMPPHQQPIHPPNVVGLRPVALQNPPTKRKQQQAGAAAVSTPSPAAMSSAATPQPNAPTPTATAASPSAPPTKSPKAKSTPKPKAAVPKQRRPSKAQSNANAAPPASAATPESTTQPAQASTPNTGKRQREDESTSSQGMLAGDSSTEVANEGSPPKRAKTEWESQPSEEMIKQEEQIANIRTDEEATNFFNEIQELIKAAGSQEDGQQMTTGISKTLDIFLKGYGPGAENMDALMASGSGSGLGGEPREPSPPHAPLADAFDEFFDFSFGTVEDEDSNSKAATPDLVPSSSTNPSPESNHDTSETGHHLLSSTSSSTMDVKTEDTSDPLRLGTWKEIEGGSEAAYYSATDWKWDGSMPVMDQPWAIYNS